MKTVFDHMKEIGAEKKLSDFKVKQAQDFSFKRNYAETRAWEFYNHPDIAGNAYVSVGGLDSIVLFLFLRSIGIDVPAVSVSWLEDASNQRVHKALGVVSLPPAQKPDGTRWTKHEVIKTFGYPVLSKEIAKKIHQLQNPSPKNAIVRHTIITGETGEYGGYQINSRMKMSQKWLEKFGGADEEGKALGYASAPFKVSDACCYYLKEKPCYDYAKSTGAYPYMGLMASEGGRRQKALMLHGCNYISQGTKRSCPFAIFHRDDLLRLAEEMDDWYKEHWQEFPGEKLDSIIPTIYGKIQRNANGERETTGAKRTGCEICMFGIHLEKRPHRFDRLREKNPKAWDYWMKNMGFGEVLDYIGVPWKDKVISYKQIDFWGDEVTM